jgi:hypothetical protein
MLWVINPTGSVLRHPLLADRTQIHSATGPAEQEQRHREAKQTGANRNPDRDRHVMHAAIMPDLNKLRNMFIRRLSLFLHDHSRSEREQLRDEIVTLQSSYLNLTGPGVTNCCSFAAIRL